MHDGRQLVYLDSAASSQRPRQVIDAMTDYYENHHANVHRGVHVLAEEATAMFEGARDKVAKFINADRREVIFTKNSSEGINLVANVLGWAGEPHKLRRGDRIVITEMEHHSNIVPWQLTARRTGAELSWLGLTDDGRLDLSNLEQIIDEHEGRPGRRIPRTLPPRHDQPAGRGSCAGADVGASSWWTLGNRSTRRRSCRPAPTSSRSPASRVRPDRHRRAVGSRLLNERRPSSSRRWSAYGDHGELHHTR